MRRSSAPSQAQAQAQVVKRPRLDSPPPTPKISSPLARSSSPAATPAAKRAAKPAMRSPTDDDDFEGAPSPVVHLRMRGGGESDEDEDDEDAAASGGSDDDEAKENRVVSKAAAPLRRRPSLATTATTTSTDREGTSEGDDGDGTVAAPPRPKPVLGMRRLTGAMLRPMTPDSPRPDGGLSGLGGGRRRLTHEDIIRSILNKPFKVPLPGYTAQGGKGKKVKPPKDPLKRALYSPDDKDALVLYAPEDDVDVSEFLPAAPAATATDGSDAAPMPEAPTKVHVVIDPMLGKILRPHQREGVKFMYDCVTGRKVAGGRGCIMADEMGLGKTLQCITLLWTLLEQGPYGRPAIQNAIICCPSSLVNNWYNEIAKWLKARLPSMAMDGGTRAEITERLQAFIGVEATQSWLRRRQPGANANDNEDRTPKVLIISYETFRIYADILKSKPIGLVLCDEGHRLKNSQSQTFQALNELKTARRVILSGTPIQNDLTEYFSLLNFVNPGVLGTSTEFHKRYEIPILRARDSLATDAEQAVGQERLTQLLGLAQQFTIRRTATILSKYLPVKVDFVVFCRLTEMQIAMYRRFLKSKSIKKVIAGAGTTTLTAISSLKKLANHPGLVHDKCQQRSEGFEDSLELFPPGFTTQSYRPELAFRPEMSGKFQVLDTMLAWIRAKTNDKIVLVSNYTQTLDLFELMCRARKYGYVRLDGSLGIAKRMKLVDRFNDPTSKDFAFLLSSKAGGCGLNLIGANRLVLFDPDWNPANDGQAMARVWRDGQKKTVFIYRMVATGTIEEKIFQRQAHKQALSSCVVDEETDVERHFTAADLKDLFTFKEDTDSDTHDSFQCQRCRNDQALPAGTCISSAEESDMAQWHHIRDPSLITDPILRDSAGDIVSMVFATQSHERQLGTLAEPDAEAEAGAEADEEEEDDEDDEE